MPTVREFFVTEATECLDQLAKLLEAADGQSVDVGGLQRLCRALRGSAQMAREERVYLAALTLEAAARAVASRAVAWSSDLKARAQQTVADLRLLVTRAEPGDRADARLSALVARWRELGIRPPGPAVARARAAAARWDDSPDAGGPSREFRQYAAREVGGILAELEAALAALAREPRGREPLKSLLRRQRALLGATQLDHLPTIAETIRTVDEITRLVARNDVAVEGEWLEVYRCARDVLAAIVTPLSRGEDPAPNPPALEQLRKLRDRLVERHGRIEESPPPLHVTTGSDELPVEVVNYFRTETAALLDRIERMARELAGANEERQRSLRSELRTAFSAIRDTALTFGFSQPAAVAERVLPRLAAWGPTELLQVAARLRQVVLGATQPSQQAASAPAPVQPRAAAPAAAPPPPPPATPRPAPAPAAKPQEEDDVVPIESLCYRGPAALRRALELRPQLEPLVAGNPAAREVLEELFDLIRLGLE